MAQKYEIVTQSRLKELLEYDPDTGAFFWKVRKGRNAYPGRPAGTINVRGYVAIMVDQHLFLAHRIAWCYVYGVWPTYLIDHINGSRADNRISNLRDVNCKENLHNSLTPQKRSKSRLRGVSYDTRWKKWVARIYANGVDMHLGAYGTAEEAYAAYLAAKKIHNNFTRDKK